MTKQLLISLILFVVSQSVNAQKSNPKIVKDSFIDTLLIYKKELLSKIRSEHLYRIQIYSGSKKEADKTLSMFRKSFGNIPCDILFETPNYKVRIGNYPTRLEAERELIIYKRKFRSAFIF